MSCCWCALHSVLASPPCSRPAGRQLQTSTGLKPQCNKSWLAQILTVRLQIASGNPRGSSCHEAMLAAAAASEHHSEDGDGRESVWSEGTKSKQVTWHHIAKQDPDVLIACCCGFDVPRNAADAVPVLRQHPVASQLRAVKQQRIYAIDGNRTLSRPGPSLVEGTAAVAACLWDGDERRQGALRATGCLPARGTIWDSLQL